MTRTIKEHDSSTWIIEEEGVRYFLLAGSDKAMLIDSGFASPDARQTAEGILNEAGYASRELMLVNTHADVDHISGNAAFESVWLHPAEMAFYQYSLKKVAGTCEPQKLCALYEGDVIDLGGRPVEVIALPGHTPGSIALLDRNDRILISGDAIQRGGRVFLCGPHRSIPAYTGSLKRLHKWDGQYDAIWPSHAKLPLEPAIVDDVIADAEKLPAGQLPKHEAEVVGLPVYACKGRANFYLVDR